ncbi:MAG: hypothetical protein IT580_05100 [Verrucomicrobiales bacterium]|nr:hypothetical protein [Verrucomicrobiales bacterium]
MRPLPRWGTAALALVLGPLAFLVRGSRQELWDGGDHLLIIEDNGYAERYRRVRYQEVEVLQHWPTSDYLQAAVLLALGAVGYLALAGWLYQTTDGDSLAIGPAAIFGVSLVLALASHLVRGPTTRVRLRTRVQVIELPVLGRRRLADRVLPRLRARISSAQEDLAGAATAPPQAPTGTT